MIKTVPFALLASLSLLGCAGGAPSDAPPAEGEVASAATGHHGDGTGHHGDAKHADGTGHHGDAKHADGMDHHGDAKHGDGIGHHGEATGEAAHHEGGELQGFDAMRAAGNPRQVDGWHMFGADFTLTEAQPLAAVLASADTTAEQTVRIEGTVADVCTKMGCWMVVQSGDQSIRVTMKEHGFGVDRDCSGRTASIEGKLRSKAVDAEQAAHYESESANPDAMPEKGKETVWELVATSVALEPAA